MEANNLQISSTWRILRRPARQGVGAIRRARTRIDGVFANVNFGGGVGPAGAAAATARG
jgi:hypothetical protein